MQATYLILVEQTGAEKGVGTTELLYYNALLSLPFLILVSTKPLTGTTFTTSAATVDSLVMSPSCESGIGNQWLLVEVQVVLATGEAGQIVPAMTTAEMQMGVIPLFVLFLVFSLFGMLLNWSMFLCTMCNSALTTTIVGVLKVRCQRSSVSSKFVSAAHEELFHQAAEVYSENSTIAPTCEGRLLRFL